MGANIKTELNTDYFKSIYSKYDSDIDNTIVDCNNGGMLKIINDTEKQAFDKFCNCLTDMGYKKSYENTIGENLFRGYTKDNELLYTYFSLPLAQTKIIFEPNVEYPLDAKLQQGKCEIRQFSLNQKNVDCGMSYAIKCCDGSFFMIDGGYYGEGEAERLFEYLSENSNGEIVISGWYFTHAHNDHIGCFIDLTNMYHGKFKVEQLFYNFPSFNLPEADTFNPKDIEETNIFYDIIDKYYTDIPKVKTHTGQKFNVRNLSFDVLYTHEDLYPHRVINFNDTSTILMMTAYTNDNPQGKKALWLGDMSDDTSNVMLPMYSDDIIKCDIVQVAHHGFNGALTEIYEKADAKTIFWPTADYRFDSNIWRPANSYLLTPNTGRDHLISGYGTKSIDL